MFDKKRNKIEVGDTIWHSCGNWDYEAIVFDVVENTRIHHYQITPGNGFNENRYNNVLECERYITVIKKKDA
jgi:hypothetical protein